MEKRSANPFVRALSVLLCVAMLASYVVLPGGAADEDTTVLTAPNPGDLKTGIEVNGMNFYNSDTGVATTYGTWLETMYFDSYYNDSLRSFVDSKAHRGIKPVSLMPAKDTIMGNVSNDVTSKIDVTYNSDGSFFLQDWGEQYYAHGWITAP